jgi:lipopolysaccharide export system permease protein
VILFAHLARRAAAAFAGSLVGVVALFLVVDFAENASAFQGPHWGAAVLELYVNKSAVVAYQTAPAAMLLAAALTASALRRTREYTALRALGLGPWRVATPVLAVALVAAAVLAAFDDALVVDAGARAEQILATRFHRAGTWQRWHEPKRWFRGRGGHRIYHLRGSGAGRTFERVTLLEVTPDFRLARRIDAARMSPEPSGDWVLENVEERVFAQGGVSLERFARKVYRFDEDPEAFSVLPGQPAQMRRGTLLEQARLRRRLGLPSSEFDLEWHNKLAYPIICVPASLLALALALRRNRRGHLTAALMEAVGVSLAVWAVQGVTWSLGLSGQLPPAGAAWAPDAVLFAAGLGALRRWA